jgi:hypothetical protein
VCWLAVLISGPHFRDLNHGLEVSHSDVRVYQLFVIKTNFSSPIARDTYSSPDVNISDSDIEKVYVKKELLRSQRMTGCWIIMLKKVKKKMKFNATMNTTSLC